MPFGDINFLAVALASVAAYAVGALWNSPVLFGKRWVALMGWSPEQIQAEKKKAGPSYGIGFVAMLVTVAVLAAIMNGLNASGLSGGLMVGFWVWLGFS